jgi:hypothetical protein
MKEWGQSVENTLGYVLFGRGPDLLSPVGPVDDIHVVGVGSEDRAA